MRWRLPLATTRNKVRKLQVPRPGRWRDDSLTLCKRRVAFLHGPGCSSNPGRFHFRHPKEIPMKLNLLNRKPRNPFVVAGLRRAAGSHRRSGGSARQQAARTLRHEIERLRHSP